MHLSGAVAVTAELLSICTAFGAYFDLHPFGKRVDDRRADAMQAAGIPISIVIKLSACMQLRENNFNAAHTQFFMNAYGDAAAIIFNRY